MSKGGVHFSSQELARVLSHYDIGVIHNVESLSAGSRRVPKVVVTSEKGEFVLKRRLRGKDDLGWVAFAHAVQNHLAVKNFPVASLVATRDEHNTMLHLDNHIYEFFTFVKGSRYDGSPEATIQAGCQLAKFHQCLADFTLKDELVTAGCTVAGPVRAVFHDSATVRRHLKTLRAGKKTVAVKHLQTTAEALLNLYNDSSIRVNKLGYESWQEQVVHGDWHPGNMLFFGGKLAAVLDFDSVKIAPPVTDVANGMLQFSIVSGRPNPADWPDYFDQAKLVQFLNGYLEVSRMDQDKLNSLIDLMVETMIAEAVLPVAATGFFGDFTGLDFLQMIRRKADWLSRNRMELEHAMEG